MSGVVAAVLAAGKGERFGDDKIALALGGKPLWRWSFDTLRSHPEVDAVGLVLARANLTSIECNDADFVIQGGRDRQESSLRAVEAAQGDIVLIQDAARPFTSPGLISRVIAGVRRSGAAAPAVPVSDTVRMRTDSGYELLDRDRLVGMQTPQGASRDLLLRAHRQAEVLYTDEMALIEAIGERYELVEGDPANFKVTTPQDLTRAISMIDKSETRTGIGYDVHRFSDDVSRPLMLGGVHFEDYAGLEGHSDADVVIHAVVDALLGAAALGDIGTHFPNTDERWRNEPSTTFLCRARSLISSAGWQIANVDVTMIGERPKVMPRSDEIRARLASALGTDVSRVGFKATTNEGLGALGRGEGIAAYAVATITSQ